MVTGDNLAIRQKGRVIHVLELFPPNSRRLGSPQLRLTLAKVLESVAHRQPKPVYIHVYCDEIELQNVKLTNVRWLRIIARSVVVAQGTTSIHLE